MIKLQVRNQPHLAVSLTGPSITVGRDASNDLPLDDASVSDFHAEVLVAPDGLEIVDLLSSTGTFVNDSKVRHRRSLRAWDVIRVGNVVLEVNDPTVNRPSDWALRSESDLLAAQFWPLAGVTVIGRGVECDLKIDDATLSRRHAELSVRGEGLQVRDLASANGVFVNEERVDQAELHAGDRLRFGARTFLVVGPERKAPRPAADATVVQGRAPASHTEILGSAAGSARLEEQTSYLAQSALALHNSRYRLGRDAGNDVVIGDSSISRVHALLIAVGGDWQVQDMQSSNGVLVNGERIESATLRDGDELRLGRAVFLYRAN